MSANTNIPGLDRPLTTDEVKAISETTQCLLEVIAGLCDYVMKTADRDQPPPAVFLQGVHILKSFKSTMDAMEVIDKVMGK